MSSPVEQVESVAPAVEPEVAAPAAEAPEVAPTPDAEAPAAEAPADAASDADDAEMSDADMKGGKLHAGSKGGKGMPGGKSGKFGGKRLGGKSGKTKGSKKTGGKNAGGDKTRKRKKRTVESFTLYIFKVLKQCHPGTGISKKSMLIMNSFINDIFDRISEESLKLIRKTGKKTLTQREIQTAIRLMLPGELSKHAISEGTKAISKFQASQH